MDGFREQVEQRQRDRIQCRPGCDGCCHVELTVCRVEAAVVERALRGLPDRTREEIRHNAQSLSGRCPMLSRDGCCHIYADRPLVCRSQGLPLRYPTDFLPRGAVRQKLPTGAVTCCELNFSEGEIDADDTLDAERVDLILALIERRAFPQGATQRMALKTLALAPNDAAGRRDVE